MLNFILGFFIGDIVVTLIFCCIQINKMEKLYEVDDIIAKTKNKKTDMAK